MFQEQKEKGFVSLSFYLFINQCIYLVIYAFLFFGIKTTICKYKTKSFLQNIFAGALVSGIIVVYKFGIGL